MASHALAKLFKFDSYSLPLSCVVTVELQFPDWRWLWYVISPHAGKSNELQLVVSLSKGQCQNKIIKNFSTGRFLKIIAKIIRIMNDSMNVFFFFFIGTDTTDALTEHGVEMGPGDVPQLSSSPAALRSWTARVVRFNVGVRTGVGFSCRVGVPAAFRLAASSAVSVVCFDCSPPPTTILGKNFSI